MNKFTPLVLWPEPEGSKLLGPPRHNMTRSHEYVMIWYSEDFIAAGIEPATYMLYESDTDVLVGHAFLTDYEVSKVTVERTWMSWSDEAVSVEIRKNPAIPDSGVALFRLGSTSVAYNWRHMSQAAALDVLEHNLRLVRHDDRELVASFDQLLAERGY